jgi:transcription initiation factor TFIIIB Brf1 subunit/transcription initiation factor TFIIB
MACPDGGEHSLEQVQSGGTSMLICTKCGIIIDHTTIVEEDTTGTSYAPVTQGQNAELSRKLRCNISDSRFKKQPWITDGISFIKDIGHLLNLNSTLVEDAQHLFRTLYDPPSFMKRGIRSKKTVAVCCLYIKCRQNSIPVTMKQICHMIQEVPRIFGYYFNNIVKHFHLVLPAFDLEQYIRSFCTKLKMSESVIRRTEDMVPLLEITGNLTGYSYQNIVTSMTFLAWQADDVPKNGKVVLSKFADHCDLKMMKEYSTASINVHIKNLRENFKKLAAELPWIRDKKLTNISVLYHVDDVLRYKRTLFSKHLAKCNEMDQMEEPDGCISSDETIPESSTTHECASSIHSSVGVFNKKNDEYSMQDNTSPIAVTGSSNSFEMHWVGSMAKTEEANSTDPMNRGDSELPKDQEHNVIPPSGCGPSEVVPYRSGVKSEYSGIKCEKSGIKGENSDMNSFDSDCNTSNHDNLNTNSCMYTTMVATIDQTKDGDLILRLPPSLDMSDFKILDGSCGKIAVTSSVVANETDVSDCVSGADNSLTDTLSDGDKSAHAANLARVKRKYSRRIVPRSFKRACIREAEKASSTSEVQVACSVAHHDSGARDEDIMSESELKQYLRTPEEIGLLKDMHDKGLIELP